MYISLCVPERKDLISEALPETEVDVVEVLTLEGEAEVVDSFGNGRGSG